METEVIRQKARFTRSFEKHMKTEFLCFGPAHLNGCVKAKKSPRENTILSWTKCHKDHTCVFFFHSTIWRREIGFAIAKQRIEWEQQGREIWILCRKGRRLNYYNFAEGFYSELFIKVITWKIRAGVSFNFFWWSSQVSLLFYNRVKRVNLMNEIIIHF
jgi:hypothetical protein